MFVLRRRLLSQNFLYNRKLLARLVGLSSILKNDTVIDIGAGKGLLTAELARRADRVVAIEVDHKLVLHLEKFLADLENVEVIEGNFLNFELPDGHYKVFANIPFSIEGQIVRKLLDNDNPPVECCLVVRRELAERLSGMHGDNLFSVTHRPWFDFEIVYHFGRHDFVPAPSVNCVLWKIILKNEPSLAWPERKAFAEFVKAGFGQGDSVERNLRHSMGIEATRGILRKSNINRNIKPGNLRAEIWIQIYKNFLSSKPACQ